MHRSPRTATSLLPSAQRCSDTPSFDNGSGKSCADYAAAWCEGGAFRTGANWTSGAAFGFPERHCCACGKESEWECTDAEDRKINNAPGPSPRLSAVGILLFVYGERAHSQALAARNCLRAAFGHHVDIHIEREVGCNACSAHADLHACYRAPILCWQGPRLFACADRASWRRSPLLG